MNFFFLIGAQYTRLKHFCFKVREVSVVLLLDRCCIMLQELSQHVAWCSSNHHLKEESHCLFPDLLRSFLCHSISLWRKDDCSKKSLTLLPCSSCSVVVNRRFFVSLVRNWQMLGTGKIICSILRSKRTI